MAFGATPSTGSQGTLAANQLPLSSVAVPGHANGDLTALEGGPESTDSNSNKTAPASVYIKDGNDVTKGTQADAAWGGSGSGTEIAILKKLVALLSAALTVSGTVTANIGTAGTLALETGGNLASAKTDLDTLVSVLGAQADAVWSGSGSGSEIAILKKIVAELAATLTVSGTVTANIGTSGSLALETGGNLATTATKLTSILTQLQGILQIEQADLSTTGTISAAQPVIGTPVSNATVQLALAQGQSTFKAQLINGGGGFTSGTTLVVDKSLDGATTWLVSSFKVGGSLTNTTVQSIVGPGPLELTGNASGVTHVRIRCSVLNSTETIAVTLRGGVGVSDIGLISSIPTGGNLIGAIMRSTVSVYTLASTTTSGTTQNSGDLTVGSYTEISIDINTTVQAGTSPTIQYFYERKGADGIYYVLWQSSILTAAANTISTSIGLGMAYNQSLGLNGRLRWVVGGSATPTFTHSINIYGK